MRAVVVAAVVVAGCAAPTVAFDTGGKYYPITTQGVYETAGPQGPYPNWCHWMRWGKPDDVTSLIDEGYVKYGEKARVTVQAGEYFQFDGQCQPFRRVNP